MELPSKAYVKKFTLTFIGVAALFAIVLAAFTFLTGDGGWKRVVTLSGVYSVCKPDNYPVVCFLDSDGSEGGMFCLPLAQVGGKCL